jgi:hypothetical protein
MMSIRLSLASQVCSIDKDSCEFAVLLFTLENTGAVRELNDFGGAYRALAGRKMPPADLTIGPSVKVSVRFRARQSQNRTQALAYYFNQAVQGALFVVQE